MKDRIVGIIEQVEAVKKSRRKLITLPVADVDYLLNELWDISGRTCGGFYSQVEPEPPTIQVTERPEPLNPPPLRLVK